MKSNAIRAEAQLRVATDALKTIAEPPDTWSATTHVAARAAARAALARIRPSGAGTECAQSPAAVSGS